jgi:translocation and assembly module TamB
VHVEPGSRTFRFEGFVNTDRGEYDFMGRSFALTTGSATFTGVPEVDPLLQITAEHEVKLPGREALAIQVIIGGTLAAPKLSLASNAQPPLPESDLISYLAFGTSSTSLLQQQGSGLSGTTSGDLVGNVAALATRQLASIGMDVMLDQLERDIGGSLGADVFQIRPADVADELSFGEFGSVFKGTELEAGKYLSARLFLGLQARATAAAPGLTFEYRNPQGFRFTTSFEPRYLPQLPTLERGSEAITTSVFGAFLRKQWRW